MAKPSTKTVDATKQMLDLHARGMSCREIATILKRNDKTIARWLTEEGLTPNGGHGPRATRTRLSKNVDPSVLAGASLAATIDAETLDGPSALQKLKLRLAQTQSAIDAMHPLVIAGNGSPSVYQKLITIESQLTVTLMRLEPTSMDPEKDPLNQQMADEVASKLRRMIEDAESDCRCVHCGQPPFRNTAWCVPRQPATGNIFEANTAPKGGPL